MCEKRIQNKGCLFCQFCTLIFCLLQTQFFKMYLADHLCFVMISLNKIPCIRQYETVRNNSNVIFNSQSYVYEG